MAAIARRAMRRGRELWCMSRKIFERTRQPLPSTRVYLRRQLKFLFGAAVFIGVALSSGTWGYMHVAGFVLVDAFLNASMILSGMGPLGTLPNDAAKYFASFYALVSGSALIGTVAVILAPLVHRFLHAMHLDENE